MSLSLYLYLSIYLQLTAREVEVFGNPWEGEAKSYRKTPGEQDGVDVT